MIQTVNRFQVLATDESNISDHGQEQACPTSTSKKFSTKYNKHTRQTSKPSGGQCVYQKESTIQTDTNNVSHVRSSKKTVGMNRGQSCHTDCKGSNPDNNTIILHLSSFSPTGSKQCIMDAPSIQDNEHWVPIFDISGNYPVPIIELENKLPPGIYENCV